VLPLGVPQPGVIVIIAMIIAAMVLGGGGTSNPGTEMVLQPLIAFLALLPLVVPRLNEGLAQVPRTAWVISALVLVVPFVQLIPLPPSLWHALPGREMEIASLGLIGRADSWMPWSMAPARTFISLLAMVVPVLILLGVARTDLVGRVWLCAAIVAVAAVSVMLGAFQLTHFAGHNWTLYSYSHFGVIVGFQANHNAEADLLAIALMACGVIATALAGRVRNRTLFWSGVSFTGAVMVVLIVLTGSRTGIALSTIALATFLFILWPLSRADFAPRPVAGPGWGAAAVGVILTIGLLSIDRILSRFADLKDSRHDIWLDTIQAIHGVWPLGSGVGSFPDLQRGGTAGSGAQHRCRPRPQRLDGMDAGSRLAGLDRVAGDPDHRQHDGLAPARLRTAQQGHAAFARPGGDGRGHPGAVGRARARRFPGSRNVARWPAGHGRRHAVQAAWARRRGGAAARARIVRRNRRRSAGVGTRARTGAGLSRRYSRPIRIAAGTPVQACDRR
jgi:hypothetical protein